MYDFTCDLCKCKIEPYYEKCVDGKYICAKCLMEHYPGRWVRERWVVDGGIYRISHTFSGLWEGGPHYATTLEKATNGEKCYAIHKKADPMLFNPGFGLSGHIDSDHWEIYTNVNWPHHAHIYDPNETELKKLKAVEITVEELRNMRDKE